jgi:hypothetical protein
VLKSDEVYIKFFIGSCHMHNKKRKIMAENTRKVSELASVRLSINYSRKNRGDNPIQDSPVKESAIHLFNENTTPGTDSTETELTLLKFRLDQNQSCPHARSRS